MASPVVSVDDVLDDGEAEAGAVVAGVPEVADAVAFVEDHAADRVRLARRDCE